jgi:ABC-type transporter Mla subunit MlaD
MIARVTSARRSTHALVAVAIALSVGAVAIGFAESSPSQANHRYHAIFHDAGGLDPGNEVTLFGKRVGEVSAVSLSDGNAVVTFAVNTDQRLGKLTTAAIRAETATATTALMLQSVGDGELQPGGIIPLDRTTSFSPSGDPADPPVSLGVRRRGDPHDGRRRHG